MKSQQNFYLAYREFQITPKETRPERIVRISVNSICGGQHAYIQYGEVSPFTGEAFSTTKGWGISKSKGDPPFPEGTFHPNRLYPLTRTANRLQYGIGQGKRALDATDEEIIDCIENTPASKNYKTFEYDCRHWAKEAIYASGLEIDTKKMRRIPCKGF